VDNYYENNVEDICKHILNYKNFSLNNNEHVTSLISYMAVNKDKEGNIQEEDSNEDKLTEFMKKFIDDKIFEIDNNKYFWDNGTYRRIIEEEEKIKLIWEAHRIGHEGVDKTYQRLRRHFYWKSIVNDIKSTIKLCTKWQLYKTMI